MNDDGEGSPKKGRRYLWVGLMSLLVFLILFWYFRIWKVQETEVAVPFADEVAPLGTLSEPMDALPPLDQSVAVPETALTPIAETPAPDAPPPPAPVASPIDRSTFQKTLKEEAAVPLTPKKPTAAVKRPKKPVAQQATARGKYTIQVGAFTDEPSAAALAKRLSGKGYDAYVIKSDLPGVGVRFRVRVGHFENHVAAQSVAQRLQKKEGLAFFLATDGA